jgi:hypothetical protein
MKINIKEPWRFSLSIAGAALCAYIGGWPLFITFAAGITIGSFKANG